RVGDPSVDDPTLSIDLDFDCEVTRIRRVDLAAEDFDAVEPADHSLPVAGAEFLRHRQALRSAVGAAVHRHCLTLGLLTDFDIDRDEPRPAGGCESLVEKHRA